MKSWYIIIHIIFFLLLSLTRIEASNSYPTWFLYPKNFDSLYVGFTYNGALEKVDAENMFCAYRECIVLGTLEIFQTEAEQGLLRQSNYFYYYSPDSLAAVHDKLHQVDRFNISILTDDHVSAFVLDSAYHLDPELISLDDIPEPVWINKEFFEDELYFYGVGMYTSTGSESDAWKTAEEKSIFKIITNIAVQFHHLKKYTVNEYGRESMDEISFIKVKYLLRDIDVLERYPDRENALFYILTRIAKDNIISPMMR